MADSIAYIGIGSNLNQRVKNCLEGIKRIDRLPFTRVLKVSSLYETEPIGPPQSKYINGVIKIETSLSPPLLLDSLLEIEKGMKRVRSQRWGPRVIDLDILLYNRLLLVLPNLILPHPRMHLRPFVLVPLLEIEPKLIHPRFNIKIEDLLKSLLKKNESISLTVTKITDILPHEAFPASRGLQVPGTSFNLNPKSLA